MPLLLLGTEKHCESTVLWPEMELASWAHNLSIPQATLIPWKKAGTMYVFITNHFVQH